MLQSKGTASTLKSVVAVKWIVTTSPAPDLTAASQVQERLRERVRERGLRVRVREAVRVLVLVVALDGARCSLVTGRA